MGNSGKNVMIDFDTAYDLILSFAVPGATGKEKILLDNSLGRVLATDVRADSDLPPFNRSAMDGFACRRADLEKIPKLKIIEEIPAGKKPRLKIEPGTCARIMTGGEIPEGADCVVKVEDTKLENDFHVKILTRSENSHIRLQGEDLKKGEVLIPAGTLLKKQHAGLMAMTGCVNPTVSGQPDIGILATGSELVSAGRKPPQSGIRNSNGPQIKSQLASMHLKADDLGIIKDHKLSTREVIEKQISRFDILILSGGVSMGDYDFVPEVLKEIGFDIILHKMKVRPGKPMLFAVRQGKYIFGLPGNPVSSFVQFEMIIKPFLLKLMGARTYAERIRMVMGEDLHIRKIPLRYFMPVEFKDGKVFPLPYHGSGHLAAYSMADGILEIMEATEKINKNDLVYVRPI